MASPTVTLCPLQDTAHSTDPKGSELKAHRQTALSTGFSKDRAGEEAQLCFGIPSASFGAAAQSLDYRGLLSPSKHWLLPSGQQLCDPTQQQD